MSLKVMSRVWDESKAEGSALLLLLAIADHCHDDGTGAWPSIATLSHKARLGQRNTQYQLRKLEEMGELKTIQKGGPKGCNSYAVTLQPIAPLPPATHCTPTPCNPLQVGCNTASKVVQPIAPDPSRTVRGIGSTSAEWPTKAEWISYIHKLSPALPVDFAEDKWLAQESASPPWKGIGNWYKHAERVIGWWITDGKKNGAKVETPVISMDQLRAMEARKS